MKRALSFSEILDAADKLSPDEQETIIDILQRRMIEQRRKELAKEIEAAQREFKEGKCQPATPDELMREIMS